jgi:hypothetical protein
MGAKHGLPLSPERHDSDNTHTQQQNQMSSIPIAKQHVWIQLLEKREQKIFVLRCDEECQPWVLCSKNLLLAILPPAVAVVGRRRLAAAWARPHLMLALLHHLPANNSVTQ